MWNESWEIIKLFKWKQRNILAPNKSRQDVQAKVDIQLLDWVTSFIVISNSLDTVVTISGWNQVDYSHLKNFQKFILWNSCGIMSSSFKFHWNGRHWILQMLRYTNVDLMLWRWHFETKPLFSETLQNKASWLCLIVKMGQRCAETRAFFGTEHKKSVKVLCVHWLSISRLYCNPWTLHVRKH